MELEPVRPGGCGWVRIGSGSLLQPCDPPSLPAADLTTDAVVTPVVKVFPLAHLWGEACCPVAPQRATPSPKIKSRLGAGRFPPAVVSFPAGEVCAVVCYL